MPKKKQSSPSPTKSKQLTINQINKLDNKFKEKIPVYFEETDSELYIDRYFRKTKISQLVAELIDKFQEARLNQYQLVAVIAPYTLLLYIKYFTSLKIPNELDKQLDILSALLDIGLLDKIIEAMPEDQVELVNEEINRITENINTYADEIEKLELENEDIFLDNVEEGDSDSEENLQ